MKSVIKFAESGGVVIGICNGFQVLVESGLLPGALIRNLHLRFACKYVYLRVENHETPFTNSCPVGRPLKIPIAHGDGNYYNFQSDLEELRRNGQVIFTYAASDNQVTKSANPNGSLMNIAGIANREGNVLGMMPHPERAVEKLLGSDDGVLVFNSLVAHFEKQKTAAG
jgi:phosphoribosylformylglycinamidine synthase